MAYTTNRFSHMMRRIFENDNDTDYSCHDCLSPPPPHHNLSLLLFISVAVLGFFFLAAIYYTIFSKFCANRNRSPTPPQTQTPTPTPTDNTREEFLDENHPQVVDHPIWFIRTVGLDQLTINSISVFKYKKDDGLVDGNDCSVCLSEFQEDETLRLLPKCSHAFHLPCIDTWLRSHTNCPLCRAPIVSVANTVVDSSGSGSGEETQNENLVESSGETEEERELQDGITEVDVSSLPVKDYVLQVLDEMSETDEDGLQPVRRSVSLNSSILPLSNFVPLEGEVNSSAELVGEKNSSEMASSSSSGRQFQKRAVSLKRSISTGAKFFTARNNRRWGSILPL